MLCIEVPMVWEKNQEDNIDYEEHGIKTEDITEYYTSMGTIILDHVTAFNPHPNPKWTTLHMSDGGAHWIEMTYDKFKIFLEQNTNAKTKVQKTISKN